MKTKVQDAFSVIKNKHTLHIYGIWLFDNKSYFVIILCKIVTYHLDRNIKRIVTKYMYVSSILILHVTRDFGYFTLARVEFQL